MDDLRGSAQERLTQLDAAVGRGGATSEWLERQLRAALTELTQLEPVADAEQDRREDY
ncbi:hypothetical protein P5G50_17790 [Leifsonia sp. F6_8S_P_1B]|uniref:Uncharacterized protein n=1 Tax=Leifsonia williamsii TaxID=3035919 RepID=A0ABT8KJ12_9MICO|nr:hypothetical protein [Leifsonia williamsii]MDN4616304.1 hypothetical protein [Leifsonia williamsii]